MKGTLVIWYFWRTCWEPGGIDWRTQEWRQENKRSDRTRRCSCEEQKESSEGVLAATKASAGLLAWVGVLVGVVSSFQQLQR